jgi:preprotein translocase subunit SecG
MTVTTMLTMLAVEFGVGLIAIVCLQRMTKLGLMRFIGAMRNTIHSDIARGFKADEEQ